MPAVLPVIDTESDVLLRDGTTLRLRLVREDDAPAVLALFQQLSERSLYYRFMMVPHLDLPQVQRLLAVDDRSQVLLIAERGGAPCGVAGYYPDQRSAERAEVAFAVADSMQGRGLGTRMLERLAEIARERGIRAFDAFVLGENLAMMDVFLQSGFTLTQGLEQGVFHVALDRRRRREPGARPDRIGDPAQPAHVRIHRQARARASQRERDRRPAGVAERA